MDHQTKFDRYIEQAFHPGVCPNTDPLIDKTTGGRNNADLRDCAVFAVDLLNIAWLGAQSVFEGKAKPDHALAIYDRIIGRLEAIDPNARPQEMDWPHDLQEIERAMDRLPPVADST